MHLDYRLSKNATNKNFGTYNKLVENSIQSMYLQTLQTYFVSLHLGKVIQRRLDPGKETPEGFFRVRSQKEYQNVAIISFAHLEKINIFCFMHKSVAQKLSLPCPLEN